MAKDRNRHFQPPPPRGGKLSMPDFARMLNQGMVAPLDRLGVKLQAGQMVLHRSPIDPIYEIIQITPVLDPAMGPGLANLTVSVTFNIMARVNQPNPTLVVCGDAEAVRREAAERSGQGTNHSDAAAEAATAAAAAAAGAASDEGSDARPPAPEAGEGGDGANRDAGGAGTGAGARGSTDAAGSGSDVPEPAGGDASLSTGPRRLVSPGDPEFTD